MSIPRVGFGGEGRKRPRASNQWHFTITFYNHNLNKTVGPPLNVGPESS